MTARPIDKSLVILTVTRILSIAFAVFSVVLFVGAIVLFYEFSQLASSSNAYPNAAEDQPHGLDGFSAIITGAAGAVALIASLFVGLIAFLMFFVSNSRLKKRATEDRQLPPGQDITPRPPQAPERTEPPESGDGRLDEEHRR